MKYLILFTLIIPFYCTSQSKAFKWPKPIKDSMWYKTDCDTTFGKIEIKILNGIMKGEGIITNCITYEMHQDIYSKRDQSLIDSFYNVQIKRGGMIFSVGGASGTGTYMKSVFIKTKNGYKRITDSFIFYPNQ